jgi:hypothetical protein
MRIDSSGRVGIGVTPTGSWQLQVAGSAGNSRIRLQNTTTGFADGDGGSISMEGNDFVLQNSETGVVKVEMGGSEAMRIDSGGNLLVGKTVLNNTTDGFYANSYGFSAVNSGARCSTFVRNTSDGDIAEFRRDTSTVGSISVTTSATSYNTSSDYRLKENVVDLTSATDRLKQLSPKRFNFIADADTTVDGFLAHEVSDIVPEAINGTKDEVDADGNPVYQGIDQSKLVPLLVATIKELEARITALET